MNWIHGNEKPALVTIGRRYGQPVYTVNVFAEELSSEWSNESYRWLTATLPIGVWDYGSLVDALVTLFYPRDRMEAVTNNYLAAPDNMDVTREYIGMQRFRGECKVLARELLAYSVKERICPDDFAEEFDELENLRSITLQKIENYDISDNVNVFFLNGSGFWLTKQQRESLLTSIERFQKAGINMFPFSIGDIQSQLPCDSLEGMITQLEIYATQCMAVTNAHISAVKALETGQEMKDYDYTQGYPPVKTFEI